ncbi:MAG: hypothetical protein RL375_3181 [Pseudomonadota bacterium]|jgi:hypothetical protein
MFDYPEKPQFEAEYPQKTGQLVAWEAMSAADLIAYRDQIVRVLAAKVPMKLTDLSIENELLLQFHALREMQREVIDDNEIPANQKAQVANSVGSILAKLADLQNTVYSSERFKKVENMLVRHLMALNEDVAAKFLDDYQDLLRTEND